MKKNAILISFCLMTFSVSAQSFYFKPLCGYGFGVQRQLYTLTSYYYHENIDTSYSSYGYESKAFSLGKGFEYGIALGKELTKYLSFELSTYYLKGKSPELIVNELYTYDYYLDGQVNIKSTYLLNSKSLQFVPELKINGLKGNVLPYLKIGVIVGLTWIIENYEGYLTNTLPSTYPFESWTYTLEYKMATSLGFTAGVGSDFKLFDNWYFFTEVKYNTLACILKHGEITEYEYRDIDKLETLTTSERYYDYVESYNDSDNNDPNEPSKRLIQQFTLNNISILAGLRINIRLQRTPKQE